MGFLLITIFFMFALSLLDFIDKSEWDQLDVNNAARLSSNRRYGVYNLRTTQSFTLVAIVGIILAILIVYFTGTAVASSGADSDKNFVDKSSQYVDTTQFALNVEEQEKDLPPSVFNQSGNNGDNMPQAQQGAEDKGEPNKFKDNSAQPKPEKPAKMTDEEYAKWLEEEYFKEFKDNADARNKKIEQTNKELKEREEKNKAKQKQVNGGNGGVSGSSASNTGQASVVWKFSDNRDAYEGKRERVPVPAYTCGNKSDAVVKVKVKVDGSGKVLSATIISTTLENGCIKNNALEYARKSRFEVSSMPEQEGTITYTYKAQ